MKLLLYILFIILFIIKCNAYCNMDECHNYCVRVHEGEGYITKIWYGVCEPINEEPTKRHCRCGFKNYNDGSGHLPGNEWYN